MAREPHADDFGQRVDVAVDRQHLLARRLAGEALAPGVLAQAPAGLGVVEPADALAGSWSLGTGEGFTLSGFNAFNGLLGGTSLGGLNISFDTTTLGVFDRVLVLHKGSLMADGTPYEVTRALGEATLEAGFIKRTS